MRSLLTGYAGTFNRRHKRVGHLFQNRYKSIVVEEEPYLLELVRYLHLNPLRAGIVADLRALDCYPWSGHAALLGKVPRPWQATVDVLGQFAQHPRRARAAYRAFVAAGIPHGRRPDLQGGGFVRSVGGWEAATAIRRSRKEQGDVVADARVLGTGPFVEELLQKSGEQEQTRAQRQRRPLDLDTLVTRVAKDLGVPAEAVAGRTRARRMARVRQIVAYLWVERLGRPASELGRAWGQSRTNVTWAAKRGAEAVHPRQSAIEAWCRK